MASERDKRAARARRRRRIRAIVSGTPERPRLSVYRSLEHIYAQVIDDRAAQTLAAASTLDPEVRQERDGKTKVEISKLVGALVAKRLQAKGIERVVFDRGGYQYHGRVKAVADGAREAGLSF